MEMINNGNLKYKYLMLVKLGSFKNFSKEKIGTQEEPDDLYLFKII